MSWNKHDPQVYYFDVVRVPEGMNITERIFTYVYADSMAEASSLLNAYMEEHGIKKVHSTIYYDKMTRKNSIGEYALPFERAFDQEPLYFNKMDAIYRGNQNRIKGEKSERVTNVIVKIAAALLYIGVTIGIWYITKSLLVTIPVGIALLFGWFNPHALSSFESDVDIEFEYDD